MVCQRARENADRRSMVTPRLARQFGHPRCVQEAESIRRQVCYRDDPLERAFEIKTCEIGVAQHGTQVRPHLGSQPFEFLG